MRILVIGGTIFVGRHLVDAALKRGHQVTLFNRGRTNFQLFPEAEKLVGDRSKNLEILKDSSWHCIIDTCGYVPLAVRKSAEALSSACEQYVFISSGAVYKDQNKFGLNEADESQVSTNPDADEMTDDTYGELKAACETTVQSVFGNRSLIIRPGLVVGPHDPSDRFTYWVVRTASGGRMLAPGEPDRTIQFIDARDLADWIISMVERKYSGIYNAIGPDYPLSFAQFLNECKFVSGSNAEFVWISDDTLLEHHLNRFTDLPLWLPKNSNATGVFARDSSKAIREGLKFRTLRETIADTLEWWHNEKRSSPLEAGLSLKREREVLADHAQSVSL